MKQVVATLGRIGELLYLSAMQLSVLWALLLLFVIYPRQELDAGASDDDVPVVSLEGNVTTVKKGEVAEALRSGRVLAPSADQVRYFTERRAAALESARQAKLFWFLGAALLPGLALLLFRAWWQWGRPRGG
jgi:hypothetical protein